jgi:hypothetical protein
VLTRYAVLTLFGHDFGIELNFLDGGLYEVQIANDRRVGAADFERVRERSESAFLEQYTDAIKSDSGKDGYAYASHRDSIRFFMRISPKSQILTFSAMDHKPFDEIRKRDLAKDAKVFRGH